MWLVSGKCHRAALLDQRHGVKLKVSILKSRKASKSREPLVMMRYFRKSRLCACQIFGRFLFPDVCCTHWHLLDQIFWRSGWFYRVAVAPMVTLSDEKPSEPLKSSNSPTVLSRIVGILKLLTCQRRCKTIQEEKERVSSSKVVNFYLFFFLVLYLVHWK